MTALVAYIALTVVACPILGCAIGELLCRLNAEPAADPWDGWYAYDGLDIDDRY